MRFPADASPRRYANPYLIGVGLGILSWAAFALANHPLGVTTPISAASGACLVPVLGSEGVASQPYWAKTPPQWDYSAIFVVGTFLGSLLAALASRTFRFEWVPGVWRERFGGSVAKRMLGAFFGGVLLLFGARMAGGCTSGHGISGSLQLALSSWIFFPVMFISGLATARLLFGRPQR